MDNVSHEDKILKIIEENFTDPDFNVNKLAEKAGISRSFLFKDTIKVCNCNPKNLIDAKRISLALELLAKGEKVTYVAYKTGFNNLYNLRRAFKQKLKITPSDFRKLCLKKNKLKNIILQKYKSQL